MALQRGTSARLTEDMTRTPRWCWFHEHTYITFALQDDSASLKTYYLQRVIWQCKESHVLGALGAVMCESISKQSVG